MDAEETFSVIIVEDDPVTASVVKRMLETKFSARVVKAGDCSTGRKVLSENPCDIVILDYQLPDGDGLSLMEDITSSDDHPAVIMVTGRGSEYVASRALKMGASSYLLKDKDLTTTLTEAVAKALAEVTSRRTNVAHELERQRLLSIFESIDEPAYVTDPETYEILYANGAMRKVFGEVMGQKCYKAMEGRDSPCPFCNNDKILGENTGRTFIEDFQNHLNQRWYHCIDKAIEWPDGRLVCYEIAVDITERKQAERLLRESEETYKSLVLASPEAVTATDLDGRITYVSKRTLELHGFERAEELIGKGAFELIAPEDNDRARKNLEKTLTEGPTRGVEYTMLKKDGTRFIGELNAALIRDSDGEPKAFIATTRDITERKLAEEKLLALNRELDGYAHAVSHDLRSPLASIMAANKTLQHMLKNPVPEDVGTSIDELIEIIDRNLEVSRALIEDLLVLAESGQVPREIQDVDVDAVVDRTLDERAEAIQKRGVNMDVDDDLGQVFANQTHIYQLFSNLIANAIKHNDSKNPVVKVSHLGDDENGGHRYLVRDNGSGIPPEAFDQIFVPFFKGKTGETGIGLAIVDKIVGVYGGTIKAYNDRGACFEFTLMDAA
ncbi:MAG: PAS domain S-box protein [Actinobacteria bacterium]|nr:PAS domain S-box protein [Actinomycetota bacterium]